LTYYTSILPHPEKVEPGINESFVVSRYDHQWFERSLHYHSEYEILLITRGFGTRIIGDHTSAFREGDLVLLGGNIPHAWFSDPVFFEPGSALRSQSIYIHFDRAIFGNRFISLPEMQHIHQLLDRARYGLKFSEEGSALLISAMEKITHCSGVDRLLVLIEILDLFYKGAYSALISESFYNSALMTKTVRLKKVHEYVMNNYANEISVRAAADTAGMNVSAFCRYFKQMTGRTFSRYVREIRVDYAQQLLINTNLASGEICFECGFGSVAYFNKCFKSICRKSPLEYRSAYKFI